MEISHIISDATLCIVGLFVFFRYLMKLDLIETLLWESFILSVAVAAFFGTLNFAGINEASGLSGYFQVLAATVGALGIAAAAWFAALGKKPSNALTYGIILVGFLLFALEQMMHMTWVSSYIPLVTIPLVFIAGLVAIGKGRKSLGSWLIAGVVFATLATFRDSFVSNPENGIDVYHYLLSLCLLCFGIAASKTRN